MGTKKSSEAISIRNPDKRRAHTRILSIDLICGFSIVFMALVHFGIFFGNEDAGRSFAVIFLDHCLADWGAAVFLMTMGMRQVLSARRMEKPDNWLLFKRALVRGIYIFGVGLLMLALAWGPDQIWWWDILTLMGVGTIVLFFCRFLPSWSLIGVIGVIMVLTPWFRGAFNIAADWEFVANPVISQYLPGMYIEPEVEYHPAILKGLFLSGYFPVFPWIAFTIIGWPLAILYLFTGKYMLGDLMGAAPALLCGLGAVVLLEILIFFWGKAASSYSLEWFLGRLTKRVVPG